MRKLPTLLLVVFFIFSYVNLSFAQNYGAKTIFKKYNDAVVVVYACDIYGKPLSQGSGVVLNSQGLIVTNYHVCKGSGLIKIKHEDLLIEDVRILGGNEDDDIMFLKVAQNNFGFIPAGNSDNLEIGQKVYALGSPLGFENSITEGIVNGIRKISEETNDTYIQLSASITHGSSGGALITAGGKLIGITCGGMKEGQNINFAIPINKVFASDIYIANKYDEPLTEKTEKKKTKKKKKTTESITSTDTEKKTKKPRKKKKETTDITSGSNESIAKVPGKTSKDRPEESSYTQLMEKGKDAVKSKDYKSGLDYFTKAIQLEPGNSLAYYARAVCYLALTRIDEALQDLNYFLKDRQDFAEAYFMRAAIYQYQEKYSSAINDYLSSLQIDKSNMYAVYGLGECYYETDEYEQSLLCFNTFIAFDKSKSGAYFYRGLSLLHLGNDYENLDACDDLSKAYSMGMSEAAEYINQYCK